MVGQGASRSKDGGVVERFASLWDEGPPPPDVFAFLAEHRHATPAERLEIIRLDQCRRRRVRSVLRVEDYLAMLPELAEDLDSKRDLVGREIEYRRENGEETRLDEYAERFPELGDVLHERFFRQSREGSHTKPGRSSRPSPVTAPGVDDVPDFSEWDTATLAGVLSSGESAEAPPRFGNYEVERLLSEGGFKRVYSAFDHELNRRVAIKVPREDLLSVPEYTAVFLRDFRILAGMRHPGIVQIHHVGQHAGGSCYVVEEFVEGEDLHSQMRRSGPRSPAQSAELIAKVADALHHVHTRGVVHRDIKPGNILIDSSGDPVLTDFGLALDREYFGREGSQAGTVPYMSPEQARREGHLVDGRSDVFSLGVVFYQLLVSALPFEGGGCEEILERIQSLDPRPPRQIDDTIPRELERICLKALSKRATDRYSTAVDMADDLRHFLRAEGGIKAGGRLGFEEGSRSESARVIPKGLRSFDAEDADFFLKLLPGPVDRDGLPDSIRFWKTRIEATDAESTFRVGLLYGPSGCGKSSWVKAGLIPRLDARVATVLVEATCVDTEKRVLHGLQKRCETALGCVELCRTLTEVRRGETPIRGDKVLLIIDQFEQWLYGRENIETEELVRALRQCDGERLQCLLLVRDDFWMSVTRFMRDLEVPLVEGRNSAAVDLFDLRHAQRVLTDFGRAFGRLPEEPQELAGDQSRFVREAVSRLAENRRVIPIRLTLFAEMFKREEWSPGNLEKLGGIHGVSVMFLEETFSADTSPPAHRRQAGAARLVLQALLPEPGADIKGHVRSRDELLEISGYAHRPQDFEELMRILDSEVRLLSPVDPEAVGLDEPGSAAERQSHYQLTHDYLVPPLREWLTMKRKETRRGRAELTLSERAGWWREKRESKQLPSLWEWFNILAFTRSRLWSYVERRMMRAAGRLHAVRLSLLTMVAVVIVILAWTEWGKLARNREFVSAVDRSRSAWEAGPERWPESCRLLEEAHLEKPGHPAIRNLLADMFTQGALTIHTVPDRVEMEVRPDLEADDGLGLDWSPRVPEGALRFSSGERIRLRPGHYRVAVEMDEVSVDFPVFIGHVRYEKTPKSGGWEPKWLTHREAAGLQPLRQVGSGGFIFAENVVIERLVLPEKIPRGFVYEDPGPYWRAPSPARLREVRLHALGDRVGSRDGSARLVRAELENGFLIARDETTVGDFKRWFDRFGGAFCDWMVEMDSRIPEAVAETGSVPLEVHRACWRQELEKKGRDPDDFTSSEAILDAVFADQTSWWNDRWDPIRKNLTDKLANEEDPGLPVGGVHLVLAEAYARTHQPLEPRDVKRWLAHKIDEAGGYASGLERVRDLVEKHVGEFVDPRTIPATPLVRRHYGGPKEAAAPRSVFDAYVHWLTVSAFYGWQLPIARVKARARRDLRDRVGIGTIDTVLTPSRWLWGLWKKESKGTARVRVLDPETRPLIDCYVAALERGAEYPERDHLIRWLGWMIDEEKDVKRKFERWLARLSGSEDEVAAELEKLPFGLRLQYGAYLGWNIPTGFQWEKTLRGADARTYPWGDEEDALAAWLSRHEGPWPVDHARIHLKKDRSPHGAYCMAGNLSEWIRGGTGGKQFLKGGNYKCSPDVALDIANAAHFLSLPGGRKEPWTGFRVVRELRGRP